MNSIAIIGIFAEVQGMLIIFRYFLAKLQANLDSVSPQLCDCPPQTSLLCLREIDLRDHSHIDLRNCDPNSARNLDPSPF